MPPKEEAGGAKGLGMVWSLGFLMFNLAAAARGEAFFLCPDCPALACCALEWFEWAEALKAFPCP